MRLTELFSTKNNTVTLHFYSPVFEQDCFEGCKICNILPEFDAVVLADPVGRHGWKVLEFSIPTDCLHSLVQHT